MAPGSLLPALDRDAVSSWVEFVFFCPCPQIVLSRRVTILVENMMDRLRFVHHTHRRRIRM